MFPLCTMQPARLAGPGNGIARVEISAGVWELFLEVCMEWCPFTWQAAKPCAGLSMDLARVGSARCGEIAALWFWSTNYNPDTVHPSVASEQSSGTLTPSCKPYPVQFQSTMQVAQKSPLLNWQELRTFSEHGWQMLRFRLRENVWLSWSFMCSAWNVLQYPWAVPKRVLMEFGDMFQ